MCQRTKGQKCFKCGQQGHFSRVCGQRKTQEAPPNPGVQYSSKSSSGSDDNYQAEYAYATSHSKSITVTVGDVPVEMLIDSGSTCNTLNTEYKERLVEQGIPLMPCNRKIHPDRAVGAASATLQDDCQVPTGCRQPSGLLVEASGRTEHSLEPRTANGGTLRKHHSLWSSPDGHDSRGDPARDSEGHHSSGVIDLVRSKRWHDIAQYQGTDVDYEALRQYSRVKDELTVNECGNVVVRNYQIVIPQSLQHHAVELAHEGHQGICKTKALLRSKVWFPGADAAADGAVRRCIPCQANTTRRQVEPLAMSPLPRGPWLNVSIDFCGPIPSGEYLLVMVDEFSRYPVVEIVRSTAAEIVIPVVDKVFSLFGLPEVIKSDNGPLFQGHAWKAFLEECGVRHRRITPLWPQAI